MDNDLSPTLGGGPLDWAFKLPPDIMFVQPWKQEQIDLVRAYEEQIRNAEFNAMMQRCNLPTLPEREIV